MRKLIAAILMFSCNQAIAKEIEQLICATDPLTTTYLVDKGQDVVRVEAFHHLGVESMPLANGIVNMATLEYLHEKFAVFSKWGDHQVVTFPRKNCVFSASTVECFSNDKQTLGNLATEGIAFSYDETTWQTSSVPEMTFANHRLRFDVKVRKNEYFIFVYSTEMVFDQTAKHCLKITEPQARIPMPRLSTSN